MSVLSDVILAGTNGARPAASSSNDGYLYFETDTLKLFRSNGSAWVQIAAGVGELNSTGTVALTGDISPAQITSNQNDYNPTGLSTASVLRLNTDASRNITGLQGGSDGRVIVIVNVGSNNIVLKDDDGSTSTAANRFALSGDITLAADDGVILQYDSTSSRWRCIGKSPGAAGGGGGSDTLVSDKKTLTSGDKTTTSTSFVDIDGTNLVITLSTGARRCLVIFSASGKNSGTGQTQVDINIDGTRVGQTFGSVLNGGAAGVNLNFSFSFITDVLSAGSHTFKPQWRVDTGTGTMYASTSVSPTIFAVVELPLKDPA